LSAPRRSAVDRLAHRERALLLLIDVQESYRGKLHEEERVVRGAGRLLDAVRELGIPTVVTEQYPERLGETRAELAERIPPGAIRLPKRSFSCLGADGFREHLRELGRRQVIVAGIETHVCVSQTVHELLAEGLEVHVVRDAVTARFPLEDEVGFAKMVQAGAVPTAVEAVLFEWLRDSRAPEFKAIHRLVV
jgi:nicotinamidase-related amidase